MDTVANTRGLTTEKVRAQILRRVNGTTETANCEYCRGSGKIKIFNVAKPENFTVVACICVDVREHLENGFRHESC